MKLEKLELTIKEAHRFLVVAEKAARRASMDLTRVLADLRKAH